MPLHLGRSSAELQEQTREARRFLLNNTRNDWSYPDAPHVLPWDDPTTTAATNNDAPDAKAQVNLLTSQTAPATTDFEPASWRERTYSSGESEDEQGAQPEHRFESPDDVARTVAEKKASRKRKRQQMLEEEMDWNIGLAHWSARRNVWTAAQRRGTSSDSNEVAVGVGAEDAAAVLPVAPPLLPSHPVRSRITTSTYSDIYTKIILQGRTPSIPINLQDMTRSLVQGWKEEGNWPPKPAPPEASFTRRGNKAEGDRGHPHLRKGVQAVSRVLGFGGPAVPVESGPGPQKI